MSQTQHYFAAIVGGAVAGSVAAEVLADHGVSVAVFEQNTRPYGKIEDGLPRWHVEQRKQEYAKIDARLKKPGVFFVPGIKLGRDLDFRELCEQWGFSAVILANGAWRDRELGIPGAQDFVSKGLVYQNPFIYWYNHKNEKDYSGPRYETPDGAVVVGGGLASIDVVKVLQFENYERALAARGITTNMHELEKKGIPAVCQTHGIRPEDCGVKGCLLIYRRREQDMPLAQPPDNATADQIAKTEQIRQKMLRLAQAKYLFRVQDRRMPTGLIMEGGRLAGLKVIETKVEGRKAEPVAGTEQELRSPLVVCSIGSVPEVVSGIVMKGDYYNFEGEELPRYSESGNVFGVGNVVTGQGNIRVSLVHSRAVATHIVESYMGVVGEGSPDLPLSAQAEASGAAQANAVLGRVQALPSLDETAVAALVHRIRALQERAGYRGDYESWIAAVTPPDLE